MNNPRQIRSLLVAGLLCLFCAVAYIREAKSAVHPCFKVYPEQGTGPSCQSCNTNPDDNWVKCRSISNNLGCNGPVLDGQNKRCTDFDEASDCGGTADVFASFSDCLSGTNPMGTDACGITFTFATEGFLGGAGCNP